MRKQPFPRKDVNRVLEGLRKQGCVLEDRKNGTWVKFPNGGTTMLHFSVSDRRAILNQRAVIRRNGLIWPLD